MPFLRVPAFAPSPQTSPDIKIEPFKRLRGNIVLLEIYPSPDNRVQLSYQVLLLYGWVLLYQFPDFAHNSFIILFGWLREKLVLIPPYIASEEIKTIFDMGNHCLFF